MKTRLKKTNLVDGTLSWLTERKIYTYWTSGLCNALVLEMNAGGVSTKIIPSSCDPLWAAVLPIGHCKYYCLQYTQHNVLTYHIVNVQLWIQNQSCVCAKLIKHYRMKTYRGEWSYSFTILDLSTSWSWGSGRFTLWERDHVTYCIGRWVGYTAGLNALEKIKTVTRPVAVQTELPWLIILWGQMYICVLEFS
jgi:hypothetical protein